MIEGRAGSGGRGAGPGASRTRRCGGGGRRHRHLRVGPALLRRGHPGRRTAIAVGHEFLGTVRRGRSRGAALPARRPGAHRLGGRVRALRRGAPPATRSPASRVPKVFGSGMLPGGQATAVAVPAADFQLLRIPEGMDDEAALLLTDNLGTGWIGAQRADIPAGRHRRRARARRGRAVRRAFGAGARAPAGCWPSTRWPAAGRGRPSRGRSRWRGRRSRRCSRRPAGGGPTRSSTPWPTTPPSTTPWPACGPAGRCRSSACTTSSPIRCRRC